MRTRAFSLIELLVVIAIIMILSVSVLASIRPSSDQAKMDEVANDVSSFIKMARQNSTTIREHPNLPGVFPSYGVHFNTATQNENNRNVTMYARCTLTSDPENNKLEYSRGLYYYRSNECGGDNDGLIEVLELKHGARITALDFDGRNPADGNSWGQFNVLFIRPEPTVWFSARQIGPPQSGIPIGGGPFAHRNLDVGEVAITITSANGAQERIIRVNSIGRVRIEE